jgi:hypothetical protein
MKDRPTSMIELLAAAQAEEALGCLSICAGSVRSGGERLGRPA